MNGIRHVQTAPYHPSSNGLAERAVQVFKQGIHKQSTGSIHDKIARVLFQYRITLHSTTGMSPAEMLLGRRPHCRLDLLKTNIEQKVTEKQQQQKSLHDCRCCECAFSEGEKVFVRNKPRGKKWISGSIVGPVSFKVVLENGKIIRCHQDQLRKCFIDENIRVKEQPLLTDDNLTMFPDNVTSPEVTSESTPIITE